MNYTYMVKCADGTLYTGWTNCVEKRLKAHNEGKAGAKYTRAKRPVELVYYEGYATKEEAMRREYAIKQLTRKGILVIDFTMCYGILLLFDAILELRFQLLIVLIQE